MSMRDEVCHLALEKVPNSSQIGQNTAAVTVENEFYSHTTGREGFAL